MELIVQPLQFLIKIMPKIVQKPTGQGKIANNIRQLLDQSQRQNQLVSNGVMTSRTTRGTTRSTQIRRPRPQSSAAPVVNENLVARWS